MSWLQISEKTAYSKFTKDKSTLKNVYHSSITRQRTKLFILLLLACFFSLLTSVVFNCEDISRWNETHKKIQTHKEELKSNRLLGSGYPLLPFFGGLFLCSNLIWKKFSVATCGLRKFFILCRITWDDLLLKSFKLENIL